MEVGEGMKNWQPTYEQLWCRDVQHSWTPHTAYWENMRIVRVLVCSRCSCEKRQILDREGYIIKSQMRYPDGYLRPGVGRLTRADRAELRIQNSDNI